MEARSDATLVVKATSGWFLTSPHDVDPRPADLPDVLNAIAASGLTPGRVQANPDLLSLGSSNVTRVDTIRSVTLWVGLVCDAGVLIEDHHGRLLLLDIADLQIVDALDGTIALDSIRVDHSVAESEARCARLIAAGVVMVVPGLTPAEPGPGGDREPIDSSRSRAIVERATRIFHPNARHKPARQGRQGSIANSDAAHNGRAFTAPDDPRIPVYAVWQQDHGPLLALGMLTAAARLHEGGALNTHFAIRRPEDAASFLADLGRGTGPAILMLSDYVWSLDQNLETARRAVALRPDLVVIHGGPSCPKYEADAEAFLREHAGLAHVLVRGEGEDTICDLLASLAGDTSDVARLENVAGITFRDPGSGRIVRTKDRDRITDLNRLPSPYLTGEFDHIAANAWTTTAAIETNRGCPYGCTFCDWGSAINSRIRNFDADRVRAELTWAGERGVHCVMFTDANFGIMARDVETAEWVAGVRQRTGYPEVLAWMAAKNTTKHLTKIFDALMPSGLVSNVSLSLQSFDQDTLDAIERSNISSDHFIKLATDLRRRGVPLQADLMLGLPGQRYDSYRSDLQVMFDLEILPRTWPVQQLPNSPMNDPNYRAKHEIRTDDRNIVISTSTFDEADRARMVRLRRIFTTLEVFGLLRHVMRWLQWDHGVPATELIDAFANVTAEEPLRYPALAWISNHFDRFPAPPIGWATFYEEVERFITDHYPIEHDDAGLRCVLEVQRLLMPAPGRSFPVTAQLPHDYVGYYRSATSSLFTHGQATGPSRSLAAFGPAMLTVRSDPLRICTDGIQLLGDSRDELDQGDFYLVSASAYELDSPLARLLPHVARQFPRDVLDELQHSRATFDTPEPTELDHTGFVTATDESDREAAVPVSLTSRSFTRTDGL